MNNVRDLTPGLPDAARFSGTRSVPAASAG
jgi:hypothetical protein